MQFRPTSDHVIVKLMKEEYGGDIVIPDEYAPKPQQATVIAVGPGYWSNGGYEPMPYKLNDVVLFQKHSGQAFTLDKDEVVVLENNDILAILEP